MAYVTGYEHDVFISYAHIDDEPLGTEKGWVTTLVAYLKNVLDKELGCRDTDIWMDHSLSGNEQFPERIEAELRSSATLLVIASPSYLNSDWCARERNAFLTAVREKSAAGGRIFRVDFDKLDPSEFPPEFRDLLGYPFWIMDGNGNPRTLGFPVVDPQREPEYFTRLTKLKIELGKELERLRSAKIDGTAPVPTAPAVFLAEVTDDLDDRREELDAYVKQAGLTVLPQTWYPRDDLATFQQRMSADLERSEVFVQLLSDIPGKKPPTWPARLPLVQYEQATKSGRPILQWRSRELDLAKVRATSPEHFNLLVGPNVRACGIEEFKRVVVEEATRPPKTGPSKPNGVLVFVNSDSSDRPLAEAVCQILHEEGVGYSMPLLEEHSKPADVREDLELNLATCDGLILVYGNTPVTWVRRQLAQGRKILSQREQPLAALALVLGPPPEKPDVAFQLPSMRSLDCRSGLRRDVVSEFVSALRG
jgi:TIR domain